MKNFSELLDTDPWIEIAVSVSAIGHNGDPHCIIDINDLIYHDDTLIGRMTFNSKVRLMDKIFIKIVMSGKEYSREKETAISIDSINIDGFELVPNWTHLAHYDNEKFINSPTSYLGFNGTWSLEINEPFYQWQHRITGQGWLLEPTHSISS